MEKPPPANDENGDLNAPEILIEVQDDLEAGAVITALRERGVKATAVGGFTAGFIAEAPGYVQVIVRKGDLPAARKALQEIQRLSEQIDWTQVDVGNPEDDSENPPRGNSNQ
jgi:hypothetical protein